MHRTYDLTPGKAHVYTEGDVHSPRRESETRLIHIEGTVCLRKAYPEPIAETQILAFKPVPRLENVGEEHLRE